MAEEEKFWVVLIKFWSFRINIVYCWVVTKRVDFSNLSHIQLQNSLIDAYDIGRASDMYDIYCRNVLALIQ